MEQSESFSTGSDWDSDSGSDLGSDLGLKLGSKLGPESTLENSLRSKRLILALYGLSQRQSEVLQLVFYHEMTIEESAKVMQISLGSARTHYARGKSNLARLLKETDDE